MEPIEQVRELFRHQRAVRTFTAEPIPEDLLLAILDAATRAPSGSNTQPWRFLVIRDRAVKEALSLEYELEIGRAHV